MNNSPAVILWRMKHELEFADVMQEMMTAREVYDAYYCIAVPSTSNLHSWCTQVREIGMDISYIFRYVIRAQRKLLTRTHTTEVA